MASTWCILIHVTACSKGTFTTPEKETSSLLALSVRILAWPPPVAFVPGNRLLHVAPSMVWIGHGELQHIAYA